MKKVTFTFDRGVSAALNKTSELSVLLPMVFEAVGLIVKLSNAPVREEELGRLSAGNLRDYIRPSCVRSKDLRNSIRNSSRIQVLFHLYPDNKNPPNYLSHILSVSVYFYKGKERIAVYFGTVDQENTFSIGSHIL